MSSSLHHRKSVVDDLNVLNIRPILPPTILMEEIPASKELIDFVADARKQVADIVHKRDDRIVAVVGPCSIHDPKSALEYANKLSWLAAEVKEDVLIVMRVYFEKPRTTIGWKGMINDPDLDGSYNINKGLRLARKLLIDINGCGLSVGTEWLDTITPQFIADLVAWGAIGARTSESQVHRQLVSGLSMPVGFKNGTSGDIVIAANAIVSARSPHVFAGVNKHGMAAIVETTGNRNVHLILRGGATGPNHTPEGVANAIAMCKKNKVDEPSIIIDGSHSNSGKDYRKQPESIGIVADQIEAGNTNIVGIMCESHLNEGNQKLILGKAKSLKYGQSITDSCINFENTVKVVKRLAQAVRARRKLSKM